MKNYSKQENSDDGVEFFRFFVRGDLLQTDISLIYEFEHFYIRIRPYNLSETLFIVG